MPNEVAKPNLYIATILVGPSKSKSVHDYLAEVADRYKSLFDLLIVDPLGLNHARIVSRKVVDTPTPGFDMLMQRPVRRVLKGSYGISPDYRRESNGGTYWYDGSIPPEHPEQNFGAVQRYLLDIPNVGASIVSAKGSDVQLHIRSFAAEGDKKKLNEKLLQLPWAELRRVYAVMGVVREVEELDDLENSLL